MESKAYNPYPEIGEDLINGYNAIVAEEPETIDALVNSIYNFIQPIYYPTSGEVPKITETEIKSVAYNVIDSYQNNKLKLSRGSYNDKQLNLIKQLIGINTTTNIPINSLNLKFEDVEYNIGRTGLSIEEQVPLFLALSSAKASYNYWNEQVDNVSTNWASYFEDSQERNYLNIPFWVAASSEGALLGANATENGLIAPTTDIVSTNIVSSLIGALAVSCAKVMFKIIHNIQPSELTNVDALLSIENFSDNFELLSSDSGKGRGDDSDQPKPIKKSYYKDNVGNNRTDIYMFGKRVRVKFFPEQ